MNKYKLIGLKVESVPIEVEANNLGEAIKQCLNNYNVDLIDNCAPIEINNILLQDEYGGIVLADISPNHYHEY